ncbi:ABC transporter substrate-binding protein [Advenella alkanexedens]|uniref:ABC transporter substrate-binding protein n=1 Tax=Advenella alkanexedens TaxID=1481665 RepID=A0ABS6NMG8_9BURK|nr:ABC transporter substrate-binding protein [Advenella alkanexedens]MBV4396824.1 ABC transporter substrate-binding protein [Advenella alkanexedens]
MNMFFAKSKKRLLASLVALLSIAPLSVAYAEGQIRIAEQHGIVYLLLHVAQDQKLIEKHGREQGLDIKPEWIKLSGGAAINDALLSNSIDIAGAGVAPLLTIWDKTKGRHNVRGVASLGNFPYKLISTNPNVKSIEDFTEKDRIALPNAGVSVQSRILQLAAARQWGDENYKKLDKLSVTIPHPEATAAILKEGTEINAHFATPPFHDQELAGNPNAHVVLEAYDVLGGPSTATVLYATEKYRTENPKTYKAFIGALAEAAQYIKNNPEGAADAYQRINNSSLDRNLLLEIIKNPDIEAKLTPQNTFTLADFMHRIGAIKNKPQSAQDYFFDDAHNASGS